MIAQTQRGRWIWTAWIALMPLAFGGCEKPQAPAMPPPTVTVGHPIQQEVTLHWEFTGNTQAAAEVEVRARVEGYLKSIEFDDGDLVEAGDLLFTIEPDLYDVQVSQAQAQVTASQADLKRAEADFGRIEEAAQTNAVSRQQVDLARAQRDVAEASVQQAEAALAAAQLNQGYTKVYSPIAGRVSRRYVDVGNLVGSGERTLLARVVTVDPIYVYFNIAERILVSRLKELSQLGPTEREATPDIPCSVGIPGEEGFPFAGMIDYADITVDSGTGTLQVRAELPNENRLLFPGMFVRIRVPRASSNEAVLVHERAIGTDMAGKYLLVVGENNMVEHRSVQAGALIEGMRVIESGITPGERYITNGLQRARPGMPVTPQAAAPAPSEPASETPQPTEAAGGGDDV
jgi:RND family efflux transporter MFP subunit